MNNWTKRPYILDHPV